MKKIKGSILLAALLLTTSAFACGDNDKGKHCNAGENNKSCDYKKNKYEKKSYNCDGKKRDHKKGKRSHKGNDTRFLIGAVYSLELTKEQVINIDKIIEDFRTKRFEKFKAFKKDGFDKQAYIDARTKNKDDSVKEKANFIEKIYGQLNKKQITELNEEISDFKETRSHKR